MLIASLTLPDCAGHQPRCRGQCGGAISTSRHGRFTRTISGQHPQLSRRTGELQIDVIVRGLDPMQARYLVLKPMQGVGLIPGGPFQNQPEDNIPGLVGRVEHLQRGNDE
jgi:hypothetical protein